MPLPFDVASLQTPCFVFDEAELRQNFSDFSPGLGGSLVALRERRLLRENQPLSMDPGSGRDEGCYAEVVSNEEYARALQCGFAPDKIVFNGRTRAAIGCFTPWTRAPM